MTTPEERASTAEVRLAEALARVAVLEKAGTRVVQALDASYAAGVPHRLSPAAAYAMSALRVALRGPGG